MKHLTRPELVKEIRRLKSAVTPLNAIAEENDTATPHLDALDRLGAALSYRHVIYIATEAIEHLAVRGDHYDEGAEGAFRALRLVCDKLNAIEEEQREADRIRKEQKARAS